MATVTPPAAAAPNEAGSPDEPGDMAGPPAATVGSGRTPFVVGAAASIGAGAIHAAAVGIHADHKQAAVAFAVLGFFQIAWGAVALGRGDRSVRLVGAAGALVSAVALGGWILAKTRGIPVVDGLGDVEGIQWPDFLAAFLALVALIVVLRSTLAPGTVAREGSRSRRSTPKVAVAAIGILSLVGLTTVSGHTHAGHAHGAADAATGGVHSHGATVLPTKVYDPKEPIDLSGVPGVTTQEQARAENLIAITLIRLPHFADYRTAEAEGYHSIHDGFTGFEHFIDWQSIEDDHVLDPDHPESLVYATAGGKRKLVSAMFMLPTGRTLANVPDIGGSLTQWHIHDNLCFGGDPKAPSVSGITNADGTCPGNLTKFTPVPMIHVWIVKNACGPFAALEGVGAGQIQDGQSRLCDHVHGGT